MISVTRVTALTMSVMVSRRFPPAQNRYRHARRNLQSTLYFVVRALRLARLRTSPATTAQNRAPALPARRFYRRVQRQNVSLEGNIVDNAG